jgi:hypothetical protein
MSLVVDVLHFVLPRAPYTGFCVWSVGRGLLMWKLPKRPHMRGADAMTTTMHRALMELVKDNHSK